MCKLFTLRSKFTMMRMKLLVLISWTSNSSNTVRQFSISSRIIPVLRAKVSDRYQLEWDVQLTLKIKGTLQLCSKILLSTRSKGCWNDLKNVISELWTLLNFRCYPPHYLFQSELFKVEFQFNRKFKAVSGVKAFKIEEWMNRLF